MICVIIDARKRNKDVVKYLVPLTEETMDKAHEKLRNVIKIINELIHFEEFTHTHHNFTENTVFEVLKSLCSEDKFDYKRIIRWFYQDSNVNILKNLQDLISKMNIKKELYSFNN
jgi:hypothetical protein